MRAQPRSTLIESVIILFIFYVGIALTIFFLLTPELLTKWLHKHRLIEEGIEVSVTQALEVQLDVLSYWVVQTIGAWGVGMVAGVILTGLYVLFRISTRKKRGQKATDSFRGVSITLDCMPKTIPLKTDKTIKLKLPGAKLSADQLKMGETLMAMLAADKKAYAGAGHGVGLYEHTMNVLKEALNKEDADPLLPLVAIAHDIGKITSFKEIGKDEWVTIKRHDKEGSRIITDTPEWWAMSSPEKEILILAVRYEHSVKDFPDNYPKLGKEEMARARRVLEQLREIDGFATKGEKEKVIEEVPIEEVLLKAFMSSVLEAPYQIPNLGKGIQAIGWREKDSDRLWFMERGLREFAMKRINHDTAAALGGEHREKNEVHKFTKTLLKVLHDKGWLVTEVCSLPDPDGVVDTWEAKPEKALWDIKAGEKGFNAVFAVDMPEENRQSLPANTLYDLQVVDIRFKDGVVSAGTREATEEELAGNRKTTNSINLARAKQKEQRNQQKNRKKTKRKLKRPGVDKGAPAAGGVDLSSDMMAALHDDEGVATEAPGTPPVPEKQQDAAVDNEATTPEELHTEEKPKEDESEKERVLPEVIEEANTIDDDPSPGVIVIEEKPATDTPAVNESGTSPGVPVIDDDEPSPGVPVIEDDEPSPGVPVIEDDSSAGTDAEEDSDTMSPGVPQTNDDETKEATPGVDDDYFSQLDPEVAAALQGSPMGGSDEFSDDDFSDDGFSDDDDYPDDDDFVGRAAPHQQQPAAKTDWDSLLEPSPGVPSFDDTPVNPVQLVPVESALGVADDDLPPGVPTMDDDVSPGVPRIPDDDEVKPKPGKKIVPRSQVIEMESEPLPNDFNPFGS